ncbi:MAG: hypothetical protein ACTSYI_04985 [Promethearchaeota archaeon]
MEKRMVDSERDRLRNLTKELLSQNFTKEGPPNVIHLTIFQMLKKIFGKEVEIDKFEFRKIPLIFYSLIPIFWGVSIFLMICLSIFQIWYLNSILTTIFLLMTIWLKRNPLLPKKFSSKGQNSEGKNFRLSLKSEKRENFDAKLAKIIFITHFDSNFQSYQPKNFQFIIYLRSSLTFLAFAQILLFSFLYSIYPPSLVVIHWISVILEGILILMGNFILILPESDIQGNARFENALRTAFLINLHYRIQENEPKLTWCEIESLFLEGNGAGNHGSEHFINKHAPELLEYKDLYIIDIDSLLFPIYLQHFTISGEKSTEISHKLSDLLKHYFLRQNIPLPQVNTSKSNSKLAPWGKNLPLSFSVQITNKMGGYRWISRHLDEQSSFSMANKFLEVCLDLVFFIDKAIDDHFQLDLE